MANLLRMWIDMFLCKVNVIGVWDGFVFRGHI